MIPRLIIRASPGAAPRCSSYAARSCLYMAGLVLACGCIPFETRFAAPASDPRESLVGAWAGTWSLDGTNSQKSARAVVSRAGQNGRLEIWLEMSAYRHAVADWIVIQDLSVERTSNTKEQFHVKVPIEMMPRENVRAVAIDLDGVLQGDSLTIRFHSNDAMLTLETGIIRLHRHRREGATVAAFADGQVDNIAGNFVRSFEKSGLDEHGNGI
jgi:hypothetical protein